MVYNYGFRAVDADGDLGDFDNDDYFFSYANPAGMALSNGTAGNISFTVNTLCDGWKVCIRDNKPKGGIRSVAIMDDLYGDIISPPDSLRSRGIKGYVFSNCSFTPTDDPNGIGEIILTGKDSAVCYKVLAVDASKDAYAPIVVTDNSGNYTLLELHFNHSYYSVTPSDSLAAGLIQYKSTSDGKIVFTNLLTSPRNYIISNVKLTHADSAFSIVSTTPSLPVTLKPGEMLTVNIRLTATDTLRHDDSLYISTDCFMHSIPLSFTGGTGLISAGDVDFGAVLVGAKKCVNTTVPNVGNMPFVLDTNYLLQNKTWVKTS
jgi:hypothetical protein